MSWFSPDNSPGNSRRKWETDASEELRFHVDQQTTRNIESGMSPDEARRHAALQFGALEGVKEECREQRRGFWFETLWADVRYAARMLRKNPGFAAAAIFTLALGIGANTAMFSVMQGVLLAPLPYSHPDRLVMVWENNPRFPRVWVSYPNFLDWQRTTHSFQEMAASMDLGVNVSAPGTPAHLKGKNISSGFFRTLGVELALGREFSSEEDRRGGAPAVIISQRLWKERFNGSSAALGKSLTLDGTDYTIVGVAPPGFRFEGDAEVYTPLGRGNPMTLDDRASHEGIFAVARLEPGVSVTRAQAEMNTIQSGLDHLYPDANRDLGIYVEPLKQVIVGDSRGLLLLLLGAVALVLLIACANVANLLLARSAVRSREFAIRSALGANRARMIRQLLTESVLLSLVGAALGILFAIWGVKSLLVVMPQILPRSENIAVKASVLLFTLGVSIAVGILFGLGPALKSWNADPQSSLRDGGRGSTSVRHRVQSSLVIVQMALTLVLLAGAGLLFRTMRRLWDVNPGFDVKNVVTFKVGVSHALTKTPAGTRTAYQQLIERIRQIPGVEAAEFTALVPLSGESGIMPFWVGAQKPDSLQAAPRLLGFMTGPDYLATMGIPLLRGRFFTAADTVNSPCVMAIDSVFARMYFPDSDPLGQTISAGFSPVGPCRIVGVVGHVTHWALNDSNMLVPNQMYFPMYQDPDPWVPVGYPYLSVVVRTPLDAAIVMPEIKAAVYGAGSDQPVYDVKTMREIVAESMSLQRFPMILLGAFAALALLLASIGAYGVISYSVAQRTHELGIRMALGAERRDVFRMVIGQGLRLAITGLAIGVVAAMILTRALSSFSHLLYGVSSNDPITFVVVSLVLTGVAIAACYLPARRAMRVDPMTALRYE
jgi:predicted permease